jgi:hypothetical protein
MPRQNRARVLPEAGPAAGGATLTTGTIFFPRWRGVARTAACPECISPETPGRGQGICQFARHSYSFRPQMARAHCFRYQASGDHSCAGREQGAGHRARGNGRRRFCQGERARGVRADATIRYQAVATGRSKKAGTKAATQEQDRKEIHAAALHVSAAVAIWLVWSGSLARRLAGALARRSRSDWLRAVWRRRRSS